ncbi:hypothetical protein HPB52_021617 [Rhipicephalus sanguineus]|uniref:DDE Tnp4 domain-containing protein n=1 Tax=Rhipicephalus sanguineus TaxID=34632 RepID=A0A9D4T1W7_RHISA|nr:hypothetical protein HPB52_021617 [Rhipicephalus sanguineus]
MKGHPLCLLINHLNSVDDPAASSAESSKSVAITTADRTVFSAMARIDTCRKTKHNSLVVGASSASQEEQDDKGIIRHAAEPCVPQACSSSNSQETHLTGREARAFPLRTYLMRPYPGRKLDDRKKVFNYRLSRARRCIENAFGILVSRWRVFLGTVQGEPELNNMIQAADTAYCPDEYSDTLCDETVHDGEWRHAVTEIGTKTVPSNNRPTSAAMGMRDEIADYFMSPEGSSPWQLKVVRRC